MVTVDDVATLVTNRLAAAPGFAAAVPGGASFGRGPDAPDAYPYCVFQVNPGRVVNFSGPAYVHPFEVRAAAYCPVGAEGVSPATVSRALHAALASDAANAALVAAPLRNPAEAVLHSKPVQPDGKYDPTQREGRDVFVCGLTVEILVQGDRGAD